MLDPFDELFNVKVIYNVRLIALQLRRTNVQDGETGGIIIIKSSPVKLFTS